MANINELIRNHITLEVECLDRIYLNGYIPNLQIPGQLITFLVQHRKQKIPSPALLHKMTQNFVQDVKRYAEENDIAIVHFKHGIGVLPLTFDVLSHAAYRSFGDILGLYMPIV